MMPTLIYWHFTSHIPGPVKLQDNVLVNYLNVCDR